MPGAAMELIEAAGYRAHATSPTFRRRVGEAMAVARQHADYAVSVSWGKDSVAMLATVAAALSRVVVVHGRYRVPAENAGDIDVVRDAVLARPEMAGIDYNEIEIPGEWDLFEVAGGPFLKPSTERQRAALRWRRKTARGRLRETCERLGCAGYMIGMRASESGPRRMNIAMRGLSYEKRDGQSIALPIGHWQAEDVWAVLVARGLPWLRIYDAAPDRHRARSMLCIALGDESRHLHLGEYGLWQRCYPEQIAEWEKRWPQLKHLGSSNTGVLG